MEEVWSSWNLEVWLALASEFPNIFFLSRQFYHLPLQKYGKRICVCVFEKTHTHTHTQTTTEFSGKIVSLKFYTPFNSEYLKKENILLWLFKPGGLFINFNIHAIFLVLISSTFHFKYFSFYFSPNFKKIRMPSF